MNYNLKDVITILDQEYNFEVQEKWDNTGLQIGNCEAKISNILLSLDVTLDCVKYAIHNNINCIVSHHPLFFEKIVMLNYNSELYQKLKLIMDNDINVISVHTPLDLSSNGINQSLSKYCMLTDKEIFINSDKKDLGYGFIGLIKEQKIIDYIKNLKIKKHFKNMIFYGSSDKLISKVAILGGSGAFSIKNAIELKVDLLISSDFKYHDIQYALENSLNLLDIGHYESEILGLYNLRDFLKSKLSNKIRILIYDNNIFKRNIF